jgi:Mg-chelatase subunit ChlD
MEAEDERLRRWRLVLGQAAQVEFGGRGRLEGDLLAMDRALEALYDGERKGGLGPSSPNVARWLGDIRTYFPSSVVRVMQADALERLELKSMLLEPELLAAVEPDVHLVANLLALAKVLPQRTRETARQVVRKVVDDLERRLREGTLRAIRGSLARSQRTSRPRPGEIDWDRTIRKNLKNYDAQRKTVVPDRVVGFARRRSSLRDVILCVDQSGSMASSVVYSSVFGAVMASMRAVTTKFVAFDTAVVDLTDELRDPVDLLFGTQLGGGTDINAALAYCQTLVRRPSQTILVLITDLYEGGDAKEMLQRAAQLVGAGVNVVCLLALDDRGAPSYDHANAAAFARLGIASFACTPELFPELMAAAVQRRDLLLWAARHDVVAAR